jgi:hypothetical protein
VDGLCPPAEQPRVEGARTRQVASAELEVDERIRVRHAPVSKTAAASRKSSALAFVDLRPARSSSIRKAGFRTNKEATMKYMMLICWDAERMDAQTEPDPTEPREEERFPWLDDVQARGIWVAGDQLAPPRRARSIRVRGGKALVTDGPFAETKEVVGGFDIIECGSLEEAVEIASGHPAAENGTIEVRPLWGN